MRLPKKLTASGNVLVLLSLMYFITYVDRVNISTAAPAIKGEFGLSNTELGLVFSAFAYPYALFQVFGGWLEERRTRPHMASRLLLDTPKARVPF